MRHGCLCGGVLASRQDGWRSNRRSVLSVMPHLELTLLPDSYAICRLGAAAPVPEWTSVPTTLLSITRSPDELSVLCDERIVPLEVNAERGWCCFRVRGSLDFALVGVIAAIARPLADAGIALFALSTYDTDYVLIRTPRREAAIVALREAGHSVQGDRA